MSSNSHPPQRRLVITGASGYLGQHLLSRFLTTLPSHYEVFALFGDSSYDEFVEAVRKIDTAVTVHVESLDLTDAAAVQAWVSSHSNSASPLDLCLHLAALSSPKACEDHPVKADAINNPVAFLEALAVAHVPTVALSTDQVYDGTAAPYVETDHSHPVNVYGQTKVAMEVFLEKFFSEHSTPHIALRSSIMLGPLAPILPAQAHSTFLHFCESRAREAQQTQFYVDEMRNVVSVQDVVNVLLYFGQHGISAPGVYNMGGKDRVSRLDMARAVCSHFGYDSSTVLVPTIKANLPPSGVASPLDISMDSSKLAKLTGIQSMGLEEIVKSTFPENT